MRNGCVLTAQPRRHNFAQPGMRGFFAPRLVPDHVNWHRSEFEREGYHLQPHPLFQKLLHAEREHTHQIGGRNEGRYFEKFADSHRFGEFQPTEISEGLR